MIDANNPHQRSLENKEEIVMNNKVYIEFVNECTVTLKAVSVQYESAKCIMKVGDVQTSREQISCALLLYLRGLDILEDVIIRIQRWINVYTQSYKYYHSKLKNMKKMDEKQKKMDGLSVKYKQLLLDSIGCYDDHWKRGEAIQTLCATQCLPFDLNQVNIDQVIFEFAINISKKSCSDVILNIDQNNKKEQEQHEEKKEQDADGKYENASIHKIKESKLLMEYLMTLSSISNDDKKQIQKYLIAVNDTLKAIENL